MVFVVVLAGDVGVGVGWCKLLVLAALYNIV